MKRLLFSILFMLSFSGVNVAQEARARVDRTEMLIGEQAILELTCDVPTKKSRVEFPAFETNLVKGVEIVSKSEIDTITEKDGKQSIRLKQTLHITSFDSGYYAIPRLEFKIDGNIASTEAFLLTISTVELDSTAVLIPERGVYEIDVSILDYLTIYAVYIYGFIGLIALALIVIFGYRRWKKNRIIVEPEPEPVPIVQPHISALLALEQLKKEKAAISGEVKVFYTSLTSIIREYIEKRFGILAHELTSRQIMSQMAYHGIAEKEMALLRPILFRADMVKFAKANPDIRENEQSLDDAIRFVQITANVDQINEVQVNA